MSDTLEERLAAHGLLVLGRVPSHPEDGLPSLRDGSRPQSLALIGNAGPDMWRSFEESGTRDGAAHPLDRWTKRVVDPVAAGFGAVALYPSDGPPYWPFLTWALRTGEVHPSPLGLLIHFEYGLWHAYRAALLSAERLPEPGRIASSSSCESCRDRPCLSACPVGAFTDPGYDVTGCRSYLQTHSAASCMSEGCASRRACPVGRAYRYEPAQASFHMAAFAPSS